MYTVIASFLRRVGFLALGLILLCSGCSSEKPNQAATPSSPAPSASIQPGGMRSGSEWPSYNGGYDATRYSSLSGINTGTWPP